MAFTFSGSGLAGAVDRAFPMTIMPLMCVLCVFLDVSSQSSTEYGRRRLDGTRKGTGQIEPGKTGQGRAGEEPRAQRGQSQRRPTFDVLDSGFDAKKTHNTPVLRRSSPNHLSSIHPKQKCTRDSLVPICSFTYQPPLDLPAKTHKNHTPSRN